MFLKFSSTIWWYNLYLWEEITKEHEILCITMHHIGPLWLKLSQYFKILIQVISSSEANILYVSKTISIYTSWIFSTYVGRINFNIYVGLIHFSLCWLHTSQPIFTWYVSIYICLIHLNLYWSDTCF